MFKKFLTPILLLFGSSTTALLSTIIDTPKLPAIQKSSNKTPPKINLPSSISSLEDIKLYQKERGCKFVYINGSGNNKTHNDVDQIMVELHKSKQQREHKYWKSAVIAGANDSKRNCQKGKNLKLESDGLYFRLKN